MTKIAYAKNSLDVRKSLLASALRADAPKPGRYAVEHGLYLNVTKTFAKSWVYIYRDGVTASGSPRQRELGLGSYTGTGTGIPVTLKMARDAADVLRADRWKGLDPMAERARIVTIAKTVADLLGEEIAARKNKNPKWSKERTWTSMLNKYAADLLPMRAAGVNDEHVVAALKPIWNEKRETAVQLSEIVRALFKRGIDQGIVKVNPARREMIEEQVGTAKGGDAAKVESHAALDAAKVPALMAQLIENGSAAAKALAFLMLTGVRRANALAARRSEIKNGVWMLPGSQMKTGKDHAVPLSVQAQAILASMPEQGDFFFPANTAAGHIDGKALAAVLSKHHDSAEATIHGFRATLSTWASKKKFDAEAVEIILAHSVRTEVGRVYNRDDKLEVRADILQAWADHCDGKSNVIKLAA